MGAAHPGPARRQAAVVDDGGGARLLRRDLPAHGGGDGPSRALPAEDPPSLPPETRNLYHLALAYIEASHPIELKWKTVNPPDAFPAERIVLMAPSTLEI
ncbi:MAG: hypothetical protein WDN24_19605 [Sphingomonas sp.]